MPDVTLFASGMVWNLSHMCPISRHKSYLGAYSLDNINHYQCAITQPDCRGDLTHTLINISFSILLLLAANIPHWKSQHDPENPVNLLNNSSLLCMHVLSMISL